MSVDGGIEPTQGGGSGSRARMAYVELRRSARSTRLAAGSLSCNRCDAPVAIGTRPISVTDGLTCPFCGHHAAAQEFLSLALPTRPARVVVRVMPRSNSIKRSSSP